MSVVPLVFKLPEQDTIYPMLPSKEEKLSKYNRVILKHIWSLDADAKKLLDFQKTYICSLKYFMAQIESESYPRFYEDRLEFSGRLYFVSYLFSSGSFFDDLACDEPGTPIAFQLRSNEANNFHYCLVRPWDRKWSKSWLVATGAVDLTMSKVISETSEEDGE